MENRIVEVKSITLPIRVEHKHLNKNERIDEADSRIDTLNIDIYVNYKSKGKLGTHTFDGIWNYVDVYNKLCLSDVQTITGPLEGILDETLLLIEKSVKEQGLEANEISVSANRIGLTVGYPKLVVKRIYNKLNNNFVEMERSAGICNYPLIIDINHVWCEENKRVENVDLRKCSIKVSFQAETKAISLNNNDLAGLYNYAGLIHQIDKLQGLEITGPIESINDLVANLVEQDAKRLGLELLRVKVAVELNLLARCTPILSLEKSY